MTAVLLVAGTHAWGRTDERGEWWNACSPFGAFLQREGFDIIGGARPFTWDTDLDGVGWLRRRPFKKHINWESAGVNLWAYLANPLVAKVLQDDYVAIADRNIIAHSHAMQVVAYACAAGLKVNRLLTLASPVRDDMRDVYSAARPNIGRWLHVHSDASDRIQWMGTLFDGKFGVVRAQPLADINLQIPKVSHSKLLNDPEAFERWRSAGLLNFLRGVDADAPRAA